MTTKARPPKIYFRLSPEQARPGIAALAEEGVLIAVDVPERIVAPPALSVD